MPSARDIPPCPHPIRGSIRPPGSKSITNRALVCAGLARGTSLLTGALDSDVRAADLNRPWDKEFHRNPSLVAAFYEAYGRPDERFMAQIQTMRLYNAVTGLVWGREVGEVAFSDFNRVALRRMMEGESGI
jgi:hypothetical protein